MAGILTRAARILLATVIKNGNLHIAFATGSAGWDAHMNEGTPAAYPAYDIDQTDVTAEFVRKKIVNKQFCTPDEEGEIQTDRGNFSLSVTPTEHLYCKGTLEPTEYNTQVIREFGLFYGTVVDEDTEPGQLLFTPSEVTSKGTLVLVRRKVAIQRTATTRQLCEFVWTI